MRGSITDAIGDGWITDLSQLREAEAARRRRGIPRLGPGAKREAKVRFAQWLERATGRSSIPTAIFDTQIKRIHEYKRQLLNALARRGAVQPAARKSELAHSAAHVLLFAGKAAPAYRFAKLVIKFINNLARTIDGDPAVKGRLKVVFVPDYCVSVAERLIPASDVSEQISTAGYEASGTSNMKFMMNGALTIGTRDGATIEMAEACGEENFFLFGLNAAEVAERARLLQSAVALRQRPGDAGSARHDRQQPFQRVRARSVHADARHAAEQRRLITCTWRI